MGTEPMTLSLLANWIDWVQLEGTDAWIKRKGVFIICYETSHAPWNWMGFSAPLTREIRSGLLWGTNTALSMWCYLLLKRGYDFSDFHIATSDTLLSYWTHLNTSGKGRLALLTNRHSNKTLNNNHSNWPENWAILIPHQAWWTSCLFFIVIIFVYLVHIFVYFLSRHTDV